jgi:EAL domain-containing protein (putative c-di-GMP-specific phosphodiesterase class I)/GGDEF domain-containing protein
MKTLTILLTFMGTMNIMPVGGFGTIATPNILFIGSYTYNYPGVDYQLQGIDKAYADENVSVTYEFLNTKTIDYNDEYKAKLKDRFTLLFSQNNFDGVIVSDDDALDFVLTYYDDFFSDLPIIFQGINDEDKAAYAEKTYDNMCGITEFIDFKTNINFAHSLLPNAKQFNYIIDDSKTGVGVEKALLSAYASSELTIPVNRIDTSKLTFEEICESFTEIDANDITMFTVFTNDANNNFYPRNEIYNIFDDYIKAPIFTISTSGIGDGLLGGYIYSHKDATYESARALLSFIKKESSPLIYGLNKNNFSKYIVDKHVMEKYDLDLSKIPENATIINEDLSFRELYPELFIFLIVASSVLGLAIIILIVYLIGRNLYIKKLQKYLYYDAVTGCKTRDYYNVKGEAEIQKFNQYALILISLVNIRSLNDLFGYKKVDSLLKEFCTSLKYESKNDYLYILSHKEILLILPNTSRSEIKTFVEKFVVNYRSKDDPNLWFDIRAGISIYPDHANTEKTLLDEAEVALNETSKPGFSQKYNFFSKHKHYAMLNYYEIEKELHKAIEEERVYAVFQPKVDVRSGKIVSYEALARIKDMAYGPADFIPVAEKAGLILDITKQVVDHTIELLKELKKEYGSYREISINYSLALGSHPEILDYVAAKVDEAKIPHDFIKFEITESMMYFEDNNGYKFINQIVSAGFKLSLDDFGTGYASLTTFFRIPFNEVKFDKGVSAMFAGDPGSSMRNLAVFFHSLGVNIICEGIETSEQLNGCFEAGCYLIQGYYFYKPLSLDDVIAHFSDITKISLRS